MGKLYDDLMSDRVRLEPPRWIKETVTREEVAKAAKGFKTLLKGATVFDVTNVSDYYYGGTDQEWFEPTRDFGCVRPPYAHFWMESRRPTSIKTEVEGRSMDLTKLPERVGVHGKVMDMSSPETIKFSAQCVGTEIKRWLPEPEQKEFVLEKIKKDVLDAVEMLSLLSFVEFDGVVTGPMQHVYVWIREDGSIIDYMTTTEQGGSGGPFEGETHGFENYVHPVLMALDMYHARNVRIVDLVPPPKLAKKFLRRTGVPMVSWKTITILPFTERKLYDESTKPQEGTGSRPFQIAPGHFAHYGCVGPGGWRRGLLFGRVRGRFWIPEHATGSEKAGIIVKDYEMADPRLKPGEDPRRRKKKARNKE